jgi:hypothetical protein
MNSETSQQVVFISERGWAWRVLSKRFASPGNFVFRPRSRLLQLQTSMSWLFHIMALSKKNTTPKHQTIPSLIHISDVGAFRLKT